MEVLEEMKVEAQQNKIVGSWKSKPAAAPITKPACTSVPVPTEAAHDHDSSLPQLSKPAVADDSRPHPLSNPSRQWPCVCG